MGKKAGEPENWRVVVYPDRNIWLTASKKSDAQITCEHIEKAIKKHVDDVSYIEIEFDVPQACEHCGGQWTEDSAEYNGGCCQEDEEAEQDRLAARAQGGEK